DAEKAAQEASTQATGLRLAATAMNRADDGLDLALLLALEGNRRVDRPETRGSLLSGFTSNVRRFLHGHDNWVRGLAFNPANGDLASGSSDHTLRIWKLAGTLRLPPLKGHDDEVFDVAYNPDGNILASADGNGKIILWNALNGSILHRIDAH